jgi:hypothetical protein
MAKSEFRSTPRRGWKLTLAFEKIGDTYWTSAAQLRAMVAELDRLEAPDEREIQLIMGDATDRTRLETIVTKEGSRDRP